MEYILISIVSLLAFFIKGVTGIGTTIVIVALGSLFIDPKLTVVLASFINIFGGLSMVKVDPVPLPKQYWIPISILMVGGSVVGAMMLYRIPGQQFEAVLGSAFFLTAFWFLRQAPMPPENRSFRARASGIDLGIGAIAGFFGGFIGINAPPLVLYFSRHLGKRRLRRLFVLIFLPAAVAQTTTFMVNGMFNHQVALWGVVMMPAMVVGILVGNSTFHYISENMFRRTLGVLLIFVSIRLIIRGAF